jgi:hypothetical protein
MFAFNTTFMFMAQAPTKSRRFPDPTNLGQHPRSNASQAAQQHM